MIWKCWIRISCLDNDSPQNKPQNLIIKQKVFSTIFPLCWTFLCVFFFSSKDFNFLKVIQLRYQKSEHVKREYLFQGFFSNNVLKIDRIYRRLKCVKKIFTENRIFDYKKKIEWWLKRSDVYCIAKIYVYRNVCTY